VHQEPSACSLSYIGCDVDVSLFAEPAPWTPHFSSPEIGMQGSKKSNDTDLAAFWLHSCLHEHEHEHESSKHMCCVAAASGSCSTYTKDVTEKTLHECMNHPSIRAEDSSRLKHMCCSFFSIASVHTGNCTGICAWNNGSSFLSAS
jgi:hypothetical protein